jgi:hypothetical protein
MADHAPAARKSATAAPARRHAESGRGIAPPGLTTTAARLDAAPPVLAQRALAARLSGKAGPPIQRKAAMKTRVTLKGKLKGARKQLDAAREQGGNRMATAEEIAIHDQARRAGQHHAMRNVRLGQLIGDIDETLQGLTDQNLRDSNLLGAEKKAQRGDGDVAIQLKIAPPQEEETQ